MFLAIWLERFEDGKPLNDKDKQIGHNVECSKRCDALSDEELMVTKMAIADAMKRIKPYRGPSRTWFANQDSLQEGCNMLSVIVSDMPVNKQSAEILVKLLLRLDRKLRIGGVDDSNGIVGGFMTQVVEMLEEYTRIDPGCINAFKSLIGIGITCFQWEEPLIRIWDEKTAAEYNEKIGKK